MSSSRGAGGYGNLVARKKFLIDDRTKLPMNGPRLLAMLLALPLLFLLPVAETSAQAPFRWPEKPMNLRVLDPHISARELGHTMGLFNRWLGTNCFYCHDGKAGAPLSTYDFPSDANPRKNRAREMVRMVRSINEQLAAIDFGGRKPMEVDCGTCHRGRPRPIPLSSEIVEVYQDRGIDAAVAHYRDLKERYQGRGTFDFSTGRELNAAGYRLVSDGKLEDAITIFRLAVEEHPTSSNAYDSLAEAYLSAGDLERAEIFYAKAVELDPGNRHSFEKLLEVRRRLAAGEAEGSDETSTSEPPG